MNVSKWHSIVIMNYRRWLSWLFLLTALIYSTLVVFDIKTQTQLNANLIQAQTKTTISLVDTKKIEVANIILFGESKSNGYLPISSLPIRLLGISKASDDAHSYAVVSEANAPGKLYHLGSSLIANVKLIAINDYEVIVDNGGHLEKLLLPRTPLTMASKPVSSFSNT